MPTLLLTLTACSINKYLRGTTPVSIEATPDRVARGEYLVNTVAACGGCHNMPKDGEISNYDQVTGLMGGGLVVEEFKENGKSRGRLFVPNITSDNTTGIGTWTDDQVMVALRDGVRPDGRVLHPMMPYGAYQVMSDEDARATVAYLRTVPAYQQAETFFEPEIPGIFKFILQRGVTLHEPAIDIEAPDPSDMVAYGEYIQRLGHCSDCHSMTPRGPRDPDDPLFMAGSSEVAFRMDFGTFYPSNLTPDPTTGLGEVSTEQLKTMLRTGTKKDGTIIGAPMNLLVPYFARISDQDLDALVAWMQSLPPVDNAVPVAQWQNNEAATKMQAAMKRVYAQLTEAEEQRLSALWGEAAREAVQRYLDQAMTDGSVGLEDDVTGDTLTLQLEGLKPGHRVEDENTVVGATLHHPDHEDRRYEVEVLVSKGDDGTPQVDSHRFRVVMEKKGRDWVEQVRYELPTE